MSGGRFVFGIGGGWNVEEMENHGVAYKSRFKQMGEYVKAMKVMWTEEAASFHGEFVNFDEIWLNPKPMQQPGPPILLGGETDYTLRRIVDYCDGWMPRASPRFDAVEGMAACTEWRRNTAVIRRRSECLSSERQVTPRRLSVSRSGRRASHF